MNLVQFIGKNGKRQLGLVESPATIRLIKDTTSLYELANEAIAKGGNLAGLAQKRLSDETADYAELIAEKRLLPPLDHPDPAHCFVTGTGLTHLGSASTRDSMHQKSEESDEPLTDSMKMFRMGLEGGKPASGTCGAQPEWFYKGDGSIVAAPEAPMPSPAFALDGGEEPEIAGLYIVGPDGTPWRLGFAIGNEFSDHVTERQNYLFLAHSKLRACSFGPEILLGELPGDVQGTSRIRKDGKITWEKPFVSGEDNMSHSIANLEHHHFKYDLFRRPGDVHVHFFGTATLSVADGITPEDGDVFEIEAPTFGRPLRNTLTTDENDGLHVVKQL